MWTKLNTGVIWSDLWLNLSIELQSSDWNSSPCQWMIWRLHRRWLCWKNGSVEQKWFEDCDANGRWSSLESVLELTVWSHRLRAKYQARLLFGDLFGRRSYQWCLRGGRPLLDMEGVSCWFSLIVNKHYGLNDLHDWQRRHGCCWTVVSMHDWFGDQR